MQLPEYDDDKNDNWPILRDAQQQVCREVPACYLVVTMNCGEEFNIHPQNKKNDKMDKEDKEDVERLLIL